MLKSRSAEITKTFFGQSGCLVLVWSSSIMVVSGCCSPTSFPQRFPSESVKVHCLFLHAVSKKVKCCFSRYDRSGSVKRSGCPKIYMCCGESSLFPFSSFNAILIRLTKLSIRIWCFGRGQFSASLKKANPFLTL